MASIVPEPWLGVEPRHLATFVAVADAGSFRGAAARIGYVQSAVSQQIAQLERALDTCLIERGQGNRDLVLTAAGETLLSHARRIVNLVRAASADIAQLTDDGPIRIAVEPAATGLLPGLVRRLCARQPDARLTVVEAAAGAQPERVRTGGLDLGIAAFAGPLADLGRHVLCVDRWVLVVPAGSPLDGTESLASFSALRGMRLIEDRSHPLPVSGSQLGTEQVTGCDRLAIALELVRAGDACAILPALALADRTADDLHVIELGDLLPPRVVVAIWHRARRLPGIVDVFEPSESDDDQRPGHEPLAAAA